MSESKKKNVQTANELAAKNLTQIQKADPCANKILDKVPHAALYKFNKDKSAWEKTDVDGTMFVYQRVDRPYFSFMIVNRQSPTDYIEPITPNLKINNDNQYIFFCKQDGTINGLWFYNPKEASRIFKLIEKLVEKLTKTNETTNSAKTSTPSNVHVVADSRSAQLMELIKGGKHNDIKQPTTAPVYPEESPSKCAEVLSNAPSTPKSVALHDTPTSSKSTTNRTGLRPTPNSNDSSMTMPVLLQKLMIQEQPKNILKEPGTAMSSDELEKDLLKTAKPRGANFLQEFVNSPSAVSLAAISTKSVHGSEGEVENDLAEGEVLAPLETSFVVGSGVNTPVLDKRQFIHALLHLMQTDDQFLTQIHQAYIDALNRRLNID